jgi:hypothetical protein
VEEVRRGGGTGGEGEGEGGGGGVGEGEALMAIGVAFDHFAAGSGRFLEKSHK